MNPRKSSTSSGKPPARPRYIGVELTGDRTLSARGLEQVLIERLRTPERPDPWVRVIRLDHGRAIVEVAHTEAVRARTVWNTTYTLLNGVPLDLVTHSTWGTLRKAKAWSRAAEA